MQNLIRKHLRHFKLSIRFSLTLFVLVVVVVPAIILLTILFQQSFEQTRQRVANQLESVEEIQSLRIQSFIETNLQILQLAHASPTIHHEVTTILQFDAIQAEPFTDLTESVTLELNAQSQFHEYFVYNTDGVILLSTNPEQFHKRVTNLPYYEPSLEGDSFIQWPYYEVSTRDLNMVFTSPIINQFGEVVGVFAGRAYMEELSEIMFVREGLGTTGETYLVSLQNNYLLTESRFEGYELSRTYNSLGIERALNGEHGFSTYINYRGVSVFGEYRWIPELQAGLLVEIEQSEALSGYYRQILISLVLGALVILITVFAGLAFAQQLALPIIDLAKTTQDFAQGKYSERITVSRSDEIGLLADSFNTMADAIQTREQELRELNKTLELRVAERTRELSEARDEALIAKRIASENSRLKSEFLSTMSHELRTPLNAIEGFTSIMLGGMGIELSPRAVDMIKRVSSNSKRLLHLINDFLDLSRIESGRLQLVNEPIVLNEIAQKWEREVGILAEEKNLDFIVEVSHELPPLILGDDDALSKIAVNLLSNAFKFTHKGQVSLIIKPANDKLTLSVSDTGIGIPVHAREYIFDEFRQVDGSSKRIYGGTGLGLALVQKLTREMGGNVSLQSEMGKGSTFTVTLPLLAYKEEQRSVS